MMTAPRIAAEEIADLRWQIMTGSEGPIQERHETQFRQHVVSKLLDAIESTYAEREALEKLVASVPDLVKSAFQEGFVGNGSLALGEAWGRSRAKRALDGQAAPRPPAWDADKDVIVRLEARVASLTAEISRLSAQGGEVEVPELRQGDVTRMVEQSKRERLPEIALARLMYQFIATGVRVCPAPLHPDTVEVPRKSWKIAERLFEWVQTGRVSPNEEGCCMCGASRGGCDNDHGYTDMAIYYWDALRKDIDALSAQAQPATEREGVR